MRQALAVPIPDGVLTPPLSRPLHLCELSDAASEDKISLQWNLATHQPVWLGSYESKAVIGRVKGVFPQDKQLVSHLHPIGKFDTD